MALGKAKGAGVSKQGVLAGRCEAEKTQFSVSCEELLLKLLVFRLAACGKDWQHLHSEDAEARLRLRLVAGIPDLESFTPQL